MNDYKDWYSTYFRPEVLDIALATLSEFDSLYSPEELKMRLPPLNIKYVLKTLRRAANNPTAASKLWEKKLRLDADTQNLLGLDSNVTPTKELIEERIKVIEQYRKTHGVEVERHRCGTLGLIYKTYGKHPHDQGLRRAFVVKALTGIINFPDPEKHPDRLDDWINTPVEQLSPDAHRIAAQQAAAIKS